MWRQAVGEILGLDSLAVWNLIILPLIGAALGASLGSYKRWYGARWQVGFMAGLCLGVQVNYLFGNHPGWSAMKFRAFLPLRHLREHVDFFLAAPAVAAISACGFSLLAARGFTHWPSPLLERFRDHPFRWLKSKPLASLIVVFLFAVPAIWFAARWNRLAQLEEKLRLTASLPEVNRRLKPHLINDVIYMPGGYHVNVRAAIVSDDLAMQGLRELPGPVTALCIQGFQQDGIIRDQRTVGTDSLRPLGPNVKGLDFNCVGLTDETLGFIATFPRLEWLRLRFCEGITREGVQRFTESRPDVDIVLRLEGQPDERLGKQH